MAPVFTRILLAYDDSAASHLALEYACALTRGGASLVIAHAVNEGSVVASAAMGGGFAAIDPTPIIDAYNDRGAAVLRSGVDACAAHGVTAEHVFLHDSAAPSLVALARERRADLIVLGTHGRHGLSRAILGSVAEDILRSRDVPVLILTEHARPPTSDRLFTRALVALDESDPAQTARAVAARLSRGLGTHLVFCNVLDSHELLERAATYGYDTFSLESDMHAASLRFLGSAASASGSDTVVDDLIVVEGDPATAIERTAIEQGCDLIIMGSHGRRGFARLFLGSVAEAVMRHSALPVLVTPHDGDGVTGATS